MSGMGETKPGAWDEASLPRPSRDLEVLERDLRGQGYCLFEGAPVPSHLPRLRRASSGSIMKVRVQIMSEEEILEDFPIKEKMHGRFFRIKEMSNDAWIVEGSDRLGAARLARWRRSR